MKRGANAIEVHSLIEKCLDEFDKNDKNATWVIIPDTHKDEVKSACGSAGGTGDWKIHISLERDKVRQAIPLILNPMLQPDMPSFGIKFANPTLLKDDKSQPAKQVALILPSNFNFEQIQSLLSTIANSLHENSINPEPRTINTDAKSASYKWDASILYSDKTPSYFNYRDDNALVINDVDYIDTFEPSKFRAYIFGSSTCSKQGDITNVKQSYFEKLPEVLKHNPANKEDPLGSMVLPLPKRREMLISKTVAPSVEDVKKLVKTMSVIIANKSGSVETASALTADVLDLIQNKGIGEGYKKLKEELGPDLLEDKAFNKHFSIMANKLNACSIPTIRSIKEDYSELHAIEIDKAEKFNIFSPKTWY